MQLALGARDAILHGSPIAFVFAFILGLVSSIGPCAAPRSLTLAAFQATNRRPWLTIVAFLAGIVLTYSAFGAAGSLLAFVQMFVPYLYVAAAIGFFGWAIYVIIKPPFASMLVHAHDHARAAAADTSYGGIFLAGVFNAAIPSPCCTPFVGVVIAIVGPSGNVGYGMALLAVFAIGHGLPLIAYGSAVGWLVERVRRFRLQEALSVFLAAMLFGLSLYYGVLS